MNIDFENIGSAYITKNGTHKKINKILKTVGGVWQSVYEGVHRCIVTYNSNGGNFTKNLGTETVTKTSYYNSSTDNSMTLFGTFKDGRDEYTAYTETITISGAQSMSLSVSGYADNKYDGSFAIYNGEHEITANEFVIYPTSDRHKNALVSKIGSGNYEFSTTIEGDTVHLTILVAPKNSDYFSLTVTSKVPKITTSETNTVKYKNNVIAEGEYLEPTNGKKEFVGWYTDAACTDGNEFDVTTSKTDVTVYAKWKGPEAYAVYSADDNSLRFYYNADEAVEGEDYNGYEATKVYKDIKLDGYTSLAKVPWYSDGTYANITKVVYEDENIPITNLAYYFYNCTKLSGSLTIPNSVTSIGEYAFFGCSGFTGSLTIPDSVTTIGNYAFYNCSGFTGSLTIPNSVTSIGEYAFFGCSGFTGSLTIPDSVTTIGTDAFRNCKGFTGSLTIGNNVTTIGTSVFDSCSGFTGSLTIPNSVTSIDKYAFRNCSGFTGSLTIPDSVTSIGNYAFRNCQGFTGSLTIGNNVTTIGISAFQNCKGFTGSLTIGNNVTTIRTRAFDSCTGLTSVYHEHTTAPSWGSFAFSKTSGNITTFYFRNSTVANAFTTSYYNSSYGTISTDYNWTAPN